MTQLITLIVVEVSSPHSALTAWVPKTCPTWMQLFLYFRRKLLFLKCSGSRKKKEKTSHVNSINSMDHCYRLCLPWRQRRTEKEWFCSETFLRVCHSSSFKNRAQTVLLFQLFNKKASSFLMSLFLIMSVSLYRSMPCTSLSWRDRQEVDHSENTAERKQTRQYDCNVSLQQ